MRRDDKTRFRITPWPGVRLPFPELIETTTASEWILGLHGGLVPISGPLMDADYGYGEFFGSEQTGPFGETYLELGTVDLDDDVAILDFVARWGCLGVRWIQDPVSSERIEVPNYSHLPDVDAAERKELQASLREARSDFPGAPDVVEETTAEFRAGAGLIRSLVACWRLLSTGDNRKYFETQIEAEHLPTTPEDMAEETLAISLPPLLAPFYPRLQGLHFRGEDDEEPMPLGPFLESVSLIQVMGLELYNHICEEATYKTCANERCDRLFVRQSGRAVHGQHKTSGVKYCTSECARAQAQREYRRRKAVEKDV